jgi:HK97 family phage major capsid protein
MNLKELMDKRATLVHEAREILSVAEGEKRLVTDEENTRWNALMDEALRLGQEIDRALRQATAEADLQRPVGTATLPEPGGARSVPEFRSRGMRTAIEATPELFQEPLWKELFPYAGERYNQLFRKALRQCGQQGVTLAPAFRALQADTDILGGYLVTPVQFVDRLIQAMDNAVYVRQWATVFAVPNAESLGAVSLDTDVADATWTSEVLIGSEETSMRLGKRELHPHPLAQYIKLSRTLLRKVPDVEGLVTDRMGYKFGVVVENNYLNGNGVGQPLGVFTASDDGIGTGRDVSTGNTATELRFKGLIEAKFTLKAAYWPRTRWLFNPEGVKQIAELVDGNGQYLWRESVRVGEPDRILGLPVFMSEYVPHAFTSGKYVGILGDFAYYWIADSLQMELLRLVELFAATNQIGIIGRLESDGMPVLAEAFVRVTMG